MESLLFNGIFVKREKNFRYSDVVLTKHINRMLTKCLQSWTFSWSSHTLKFHKHMLPRIY